MCRKHFIIQYIHMKSIFKIQSIPISIVRKLLYSTFIFRIKNILASIFRKSLCIYVKPNFRKSIPIIMVSKHLIDWFIPNCISLADIRTRGNRGMVLRSSCNRRNTGKSKYNEKLLFPLNQNCLHLQIFFKNNKQSYC